MWYEFFGKSYPHSIAKIRISSFNMHLEVVISSQNKFMFPLQPDVMMCSEPGFYLLFQLVNSYRLGLSATRDGRRVRPDAVFKGS